MEQNNPSQKLTLNNELKTEFILNLLEAISDPIFVKDKQHRWIYANSAFAKIIGMPLEKLVGLSDPDIFPQEMADHFWKLDDETFKSCQTTHIEEKIQIDGEVREILTKKSIVMDPTNGEPILVGIIRDISERKKLERQILEQSKMAVLGNMATGMSHEINNPLTIIASRISLILSKIDSGKFDIKDIRSDLEKVLANSFRIEKIISSLKSFSYDGSRDEFSPSALGKILEDTLNLCRERIKSIGIEIRIVGETNIKLNCRASQISQVFMNLLSNSFDAINKLEEKWIEISVEATDLKMIIKFTDSGHGIKADVANKMMDPFYTTKGVGSGTGLGLSISKSIIESHIGSLYLNTNYKNTQFIIELPR